MKAYIAAPIFTPEQLAVVEDIKAALEDIGYDVFSPYHASRSIWRGRAPKDCSPAERRTVLHGNIDNLDCDLVVAWVGGGLRTDVGVAWELGWASCLSAQPRASFGTACPMILAYIDPSDPKQAMNLMLAETVDYVVRHPDSLYAFLKTLWDEGDLDPWRAGGAELDHEEEPIK